jgi:putative flippase GtrA
MKISPKNKKLIRYILVGGSVYLVEMFALLVLENFLNFSPLSSVAISFWIGFLLAFILQKLFTFGNSDIKHKTVAIQMVKYSLLVLWNYAFSLLMVKLLSFAVATIFIRTISIAIMTIWNFVIYNKIFTESVSKNVEKSEK